MSLDQWFLFVGVCLTASMTPGPGILTVIAHSIDIGIKRTIPVMFGILTGLSLLAFLAIVGLGAILESSKTLLIIMKLMGAGYLFYLGGRLLISKNTTSIPVRSGATQDRPIRQFMHGLCVSFVNPKAIGFFSALFLQFVDGTGGVFTQLAILYITLVGCSIFALLFYSFGAQLISPAIKKYARVFNRLTGGCFIGLSALLVLSEN
jgi:homoserine/homoserine lactone efflux protein